MAARKKKAHYRSEDLVRLRCKHLSGGYSVFEMLGDHFDTTWCPVCEIHQPIVGLATQKEILERIGGTK